MSATIEAKQASLHQSPVSSKSQPADNEIIAARQIVEALAAKHGLPVETKVEGGLIHVRALPMQARIGSVTHRDTALGNYDGVLGLLSTLSGLPYSMSYRSFCAGTECPSQLDFSLEVKGLAK